MTPEDLPGCRGQDEPWLVLHPKPSAAALSDAIVKSHGARIRAKLGLGERVQAVVLAYETGLVRPGTRPAPGPGR